MRAATYLRQSVDHAEGIDRQIERTRALIAARSWQLVGEYADNDTSASKARGEGTGWARMLRDIEAGRVEAVVAVDLDRLLRSTRDLNALIERGAKVVTVDGEIDLSTADGEFRATMLAGIARFEVRRKSERQVRANEARARAGRVVRGRRPFGYEADGLTVRPEEAEAVRAGYAALLDGSTLASIAAAWNEAGLRTGQDGPWRHDNVRHVLLNPRYRGAVRRHGEIVHEQAEWPALVDADTFRAAEAILTDPARRTGAPSVKRLLSGIAECGVCGSLIHAGGGARRGVANYRCKGALGHFARRAEPVEAHVVDVVTSFLANAKGADGQLILPAILAGAEGDELATEAEKVRGRIERLRAAFLADDDADEAEYAATSRGLRDRLADIEQRIVERMRAAELTDLLGNPDARAVWDALTLERQRRVLRALPLRIVVHAPGRGVRTFDPSTVEVTAR